MNAALPVPPSSVIRSLAALATSLLGLASPAVGQAGSTDPRPSWSLLRQDEDWSSIDAVPDDELERLDKIKWLPLDRDGDWRLTLGGTVRARIEAFDAFGFGFDAPARTDDVYQLFFVHSHADVRHRSGLRAYLELESALAWDRELPGGTRTSDENQFDIYQGFVEQRFELDGQGSLSVRVGRQALSYGRLRLVSPLPWANVFNRFQGALARLEQGDWRVDGFWTEAVAIDIDEFDEPNDDALFGLYASRRHERDVLELYLLGVDRPQRAFNGTAGDEQRYTAGFRVGRSPFPGELDYDLEVAQQFGELGAGDVSATMVGAELGYRFDSERGPRIEVQLELGTGDGSPGGDVGTFDTPYPLGHAYFGIADTLGRQNAIDLGVGIELPVSGGWSLSGTAHQFWRENSADAIYQVNGSPYAGSAGVGGNDLGQELDLILSRRLGRHLDVQIGLAHFFVGGALEANGRVDDVSFAYLQTTLVF